MLSYYIDHDQDNGHTNTTFFTFYMYLGITTTRLTSKVTVLMSMLSSSMITMAISPS
jgi:hypothetical protein